jgi:predicted ATPase
MVLVGPNGAGKTNLVRALEVFGEILSRGTVEPIQEHGYDQLIRREKRPARTGLFFSLRFEVPSSIAEKQLPVPLIFEVGIGVSGSIYSDEVFVTREELRLRAPKARLPSSVMNVAAP